MTDDGDSIKSQRKWTDLSEKSKIPNELANQLDVDDLTAVAERLGVPLDQLRQWRLGKLQKELHKDGQYNLGRIVLELLAEKLISPSELKEMPVAAQQGLVAHIAVTTFGAANRTRVDAVLASVQALEEKASSRHGLSDRDWGLLESAMDSRGFTEEWMNGRDDEDLAFEVAVKACLHELPTRTRRAFESYLAEQTAWGQSILERAVDVLHGERPMD